MTTKATWMMLAEDCEQAEEANRGIEFAIHEATGRRIGDDTPKYTMSLDAITALIERGLPGWSRASGYCDKAHEDRSDDPALDQPCGGWASLWAPDNDGDGIEAKGCSTEPLARCAAFCRAMAEKATA